MVIAGIVLYNPDLQRLQQNIEAIKYQINKIVLVDNGSQNIDEIRYFLKQYETCYLIENATNKGIATALNQIVFYADRLKSNWVLTLDQDSICFPGLINGYMKYIDIPDVALITCRIKDRNFRLEAEDASFGEYRLIDKCITSGSFLNVAASKSIGGFDENLFIDKVDTDLCMRLSIAKYKIIQVNMVGLLHEVGNNTKVKRIGQKEIVVFNHTAFRCYYIIRNQIYFARKFKNELGKKEYRKAYWAAYHRLLIYFIFEKYKFKKLKAGFKGLIDGHKMKNY